VSDQPVRLNHPTPGEAVLVIDGTEYRLRRVLLDELERFMLGLAELQDRLAAEPETPTTTAESLKRAFAERRALVAWWAEIIATLCPDSPPLPESVPAWLASGDLATEMVALWQGSPLAPGG
jgi:hypothetical protein